MNPFITRVGGSLGAIITMALCTATTADARPVSYPGGWTFMQQNHGDHHSLHAHYSPTAKDSIGYRFEYWRPEQALKEDWQQHSIQWNRLVHRWNNPASQANLYLKSGIGFAHTDNQAAKGDIEPALFTGLAADWEDRRWFVSYENRANYAGDIDRSFSQSFRAGVAPYVGDYGDLHTWLMVQLDHKPGEEDAWTVTPLVRLFKGVTLVEAGVSDDGKAMVNCILRF